MDNCPLVKSIAARPRLHPRSAFIHPLTSNALTGKTAPLFRQIRSAEHPHMRGENVAFLALLNLNHGTSPHVWGKLPNEPRGQVTTRNIPTCVGKTAASARVSPPRAEHPHMCGENGRTGAEGVSATGTSPHVWGKTFITPKCDS